MLQPSTNAVDKFHLPRGTMPYEVTRVDSITTAWTRRNAILVMATRYGVMAIAANVNSYKRLLTNISFFKYNKTSKQQYIPFSSKGGRHRRPHNTFQGYITHLQGWLTSSSTQNISKGIYKTNFQGWSSSTSTQITYHQPSARVC